MHVGQLANQSCAWCSSWLLAILRSESYEQDHYNSLWWFIIRLVCWTNWHDNLSPSAHDNRLLWELFSCLCNKLINKQREKSIRDADNISKQEYWSASNEHENNQKSSRRTIIMTTTCNNTEYIYKLIVNYERRNYLPSSVPDIRPHCLICRSVYPFVWASLGIHWAILRSH